MESKNDTPRPSKKEIVDTHILSIARKQVSIDPASLHALTYSMFVMDIDAKVSLRSLMANGAILAGNDLLSEDVANNMNRRVLEVIREERTKNFPTNNTPKAPDPNADPVLRLGPNDDITLGQLAGVLHQGQDERFVSENLTKNMLAYVYDQGSNPSKYTQGMVSKMVFKILSKVANPVDVANGMMSVQGFTWKDDGMPSNKAFKIYQDSKSKMKM